MFIYEQEKAYVVRDFVCVCVFVWGGGVPSAISHLQTHYPLSSTSECEAYKPGRHRERDRVAEK